MIVTCPVSVFVQKAGQATFAMLNTVLKIAKTTVFVKTTSVSAHLASPVNYASLKRVFLTVTVRVSVLRANVLAMLVGKETVVR